ncbi:stomatin (EPB72)-like 3a isoform X1 [Corythoichthys intestinalis]|uniref:stomatin (EPB72)-like 3a isoform X1 n=1 Tax=Corythoichthys intestinalis TaxID=161448 RepID=UPI0025A576A5|nr:stomatin (EPB72)-like 3a isoform X1 [Corythoichthys intestinalis]
MISTTSRTAEMVTQGKLEINSEDAVEDKSSGKLGCFGWILVIISLLFIGVTFPLTIFMCVKIVQEYERAVIFRLGRIVDRKAKGPGLFFVIPCTDNFVKVDLRTVSFDIPPQEILTKDSVTVCVDGVVYFRIRCPISSVANVSNAHSSTRLLAQTTLRNALGTKNLAELLSDREGVSLDMQVAYSIVGRGHGRVGHQGGARGDQRHQVTSAAAAGHGGRGRSQSGGPRQDDRGRGRDEGVAGPEGGVAGHRRGAVGLAAALPADAQQHRRREEFHHRVPASHRIATGLRGGEVMNELPWQAIFMLIIEHIHTRIVKSVGMYTLLAKSIGTPGILSDNAQFLPENDCNYKCFGSNIFIDFACNEKTQKTMKKKKH